MTAESQISVIPGLNSGRICESYQSYRVVPSRTLGTSEQSYPYPPLRGTVLLNHRYESGHRRFPVRLSVSCPPDTGRTVPALWSSSGAKTKPNMGDRLVMLKRPNGGEGRTE